MKDAPPVDKAEGTATKPQAGSKATKYEAVYGRNA
jgi:hypothetical protein